MNREETADLVIVGGGAAGLATAIFSRRHSPVLRVVCLDGARKIGAKILVSGGSRCNVTNRVVTERDFWGGSPRAVRNVLRAFPSTSAAAFFEGLGVALHEEEDGKLFPDTNRSRTVLDALLDEAARLGIVIATGTRVTGIDRTAERFVVQTPAATLEARRVVLATGGQSLPKTGSDGLGYALARRLGHGHVETTPALAPLVLADQGGGSIRHAPLAGVSHPAAMTLRIGGRVAHRLEGALLWTHFGVSGPLALNMSRHWHRARLDGGNPDVSLSVCPGDTFESLESWLLEQERVRPRAHLSTVLSARMPSALAGTCLAAGRLDRDTTMAHLTRDERRALVRVLTDSPLSV